MSNFTPERLHVDVSTLVQRFGGPHPLTGIERVALEYARWCVAAGGHLCVRERNQLVEFPADRWPVGLVPGFPGRPPPRELPFLGPILARFRGQSRPLPEGSWVVNATTNWLERGPLWRWATEQGVHIVVFIHDLLPIEFPEYFPANQLGHHAFLMSKALGKGRAIVVNSQATEESLLRWAWTFGIQPPPVLVAPLGHRPLPAPSPEVPSRVRSPYFLALGTIEPRKNHLLLLTLWREMALRGEGPPPTLVIVGRRGWECEQVLDLLDRSDAIRTCVVEVNDADDAQLAALMEGAQALLMPSFSEGFGMPVQEALASGTPVICSPIPSVQEFAGSVPDYAEPFDGVRWLELIEGYAREGSPLRARQLERMKAYRPNAWSDHFARVERFLELQGR